MPHAMEAKRSYDTTADSPGGIPHSGYRPFPPPKSRVLNTYLRVSHIGGVTLRMAAEIVKAIQPLDAEIALVHNGVVANAHSILSIVSLAAAQADRIYVWAHGPDAEEAVEVLAKAFAGGLGLQESIQ